MKTRTMKKWTSMIVVLAMIMTFISVPTMAKPMEVYETPTEDILYSNDFESGKAEDPWVVGGETYTKEAMSGDTSIADGVLKIAPSGDGNTKGRLTKGNSKNEGISGEYFVEFKLKVPEYPAGATTVRIWGVGNLNANNYTYFDIAPAILGAADVWHNIKIYFDTDNGIRKLWINGDLIKKDTYTSFGAHNRIMDVNGIASAQYYDELKIYKLNDDTIGTEYLTRNFEYPEGTAENKEWLTEDGLKFTNAAMRHATHTADGWLKLAPTDGDNDGTIETNNASGTNETARLTKYSSSDTLDRVQYAIEFDFKKESYAKNDVVWKIGDTNWANQVAVKLSDVFATTDKFTPNEVYKIKLLIDLANGNVSILRNDTIVKTTTVSIAEGATFNRIIDVDGVTTAQYYDNLRIYKNPVGYKLIASDNFSGYSSDVTYPVGVATQFMGIQTRSDWDGANIKINAQEGRLEVDGTDSNPKLMHMYNEYTGKIMVSEFDFTPVSEAEEEVYVYYTTHKADNHRGFNLMAGKGRLVFVSTNGEKIELCKYTLGETYKIKLYMNLNETFTIGDTERTGSCDIYINDVCVAADLKPFYGTVEANIEEFGRTVISATKNKYYMDNMKFYYDERENIISDISGAIINACPDGIVDGDKITLPTTTVSGYNVTWATSDEAAIDTEGNVTKTADPQYVTLTATVSDAANTYSAVVKYDFVVAGDPFASVGEFTDGKISATANFAPADSVVIVAVYKEGVLKAVKLETVSETVKSATVDCSSFDNGNYTAKGFLWKSMSSLEPLSAATSEKSFTIGEN